MTSEWTDGQWGTGTRGGFNVLEDVIISTQILSDFKQQRRWTLGEHTIVFYPVTLTIWNIATSFSAKKKKKTLLVLMASQLWLKEVDYKLKEQLHPVWLEMLPRCLNHVVYWEHGARESLHPEQLLQQGGCARPRSLYCCSVRLHHRGTGHHWECPGHVCVLQVSHFFALCVCHVFECLGRKKKEALFC